VKIIYLFIDGIGLGKNDPDTNPFARYARSFLSVLAGKSSDLVGMTAVETDAQMGIPGLPQSATGQTALWTGINAPRLLGHHMTGFPGPTLVRTIHDHSIIKIFVDQEKKATLLNAYSLTYFSRIIENPRLTSASTHVQLASGQAPFTLDDLKAGRGLYTDITNEFLPQLHPELNGAEFPVIPAFQRGIDLVRMSEPYDFVTFEYFLTDKAGHDQSFSFAAKTIRTVEEFVAGILSEMDHSRTLLILTSDHGNLEDLGTKTHTENPVVTFAFGSGAKEMEKRVKDLKDIPRFIYEVCGMEVEFDDEPSAG